MTQIFKTLTLALAFSVSATAQQKDKAIFVTEPVSYYQHTIVKSLTGTYDSTLQKKLKIDYKNKNFPTDPALYNTIWYSAKISQGNTGTCWSFSTSSFMESEIKRLTNKEVNLSEMYTVYWEYIERIKYFVKHKGKMHLGEGSETNAIAKIMELYGAVPYRAYTGKKEEQDFYNHEPMFEEINDLFESIKQKQDWDEEKAVLQLKNILNQHIGVPPTKIEVDHKKMTPKEYVHYIGLNPKDYVNFMSLMEIPYYQKGLYNVPDNWWRSKDYNNIPLDDFMALIKTAIEQGYSMSIGGDVSEPGFDKITQTATIPTFDIPSEYIDEGARQLRFSNGSTTDDHAMHLVGYHITKDGTTWFLIKDSGSGSRNADSTSNAFGFYFMHEDYIKLKMMTITLHKDAAKEYLAKIKK